jgi:hypothetical protein
MCSGLVLEDSRVGRSGQKEVSSRCGELLEQSIGRWNYLQPDGVPSRGRKSIRELLSIYSTLFTEQALVGIACHFYVYAPAMPRLYRGNRERG